MKRVTSWILKNPTRIALLLGLILGAVHASLLGGMLLRRSHIRDLRFQVDSLEANLTELRQIEDATLAALQQELEATQARAAELEASFPEIGPAFEKARQRGVHLRRIERIAEELEDTEVGKLHFVTYAVEGEADLRPQIYETIRQRDWILLEFQQQRRSLEDVFRQLTREN